MEFRLILILFLGFIVGWSQGYQFNVGGRDGWVLKPKEKFNCWAERNRFQVNDTLYFKFKEGSDSVMEVTKHDYYNCITKNPIQHMTDGDSIFKFNRSGPFFFVSGVAHNCLEGQRLIVIVLSPYHHKKIAPSASPPSSTDAPPPLVPSSKANGTRELGHAPSPQKSGSQGLSVYVGFVLGAIVLCLM